MKNKFLNILALGVMVLGLGLTSCTDDLNTVPEDKDQLLAEDLFKDPTAYKGVLAKLYAGLATTGQEGPAGAPDITGIDEGFSDYVRGYWNAQELSTDEAVNGWGDGSLPDYHDMDWTASNEFIRGFYSRCYYQITGANNYLQKTTDAKLDARGESDAVKAEVAIFRAEARFLRALSYWHLLDLFRNVPFVTEEDPLDQVGQFFPEQTNAAELFTYLETELKDIETQLVDAGANEYARADKAAAWTLLAKLYLNAEVYINTAKYTECISYCNKITAAGYSLNANYNELFLADNHTASGVIFPVAYDGLNTQTWGGTTYLVHAPVGGDMDPEAFGINGGWWGNRTTSAFAGKFDTEAADDRNMLFTTNQNLEINNIGTFTDGFSIAKWKNVDKDGNAGSDPSGDFPDTDFPMFRLADVYLMYAEATLRNGVGGDVGTSLGYVNDLRTRANATTVSSINLDFILDERARELHWEAYRRTDLIRYNKFTGSSYVWPWKGGVKEGQSVEDFRNIYPLPAADVNANGNLVQNTGY